MSRPPASALKPIDARMRWIWSVQWLAFLLPAALVGAVFLLGPGRVLAMDGTALLALAGLALALVLAVTRYAHLYWQRFRHAEIEDGLLIESGVWWRKCTLVPRSRVQHTDVKHGPLERRLGLATLLVHTAATRHMAVTVPGLSEAEAEALRHSLLERGGDDAL
jgi:membrane protein YdbS with pleckstrin-like domain